MLTFNPHKRISAFRALQHSYLQKAEGNPEWAMVWLQQNQEKRSCHCPLQLLIGETPTEKAGTLCLFYLWGCGYASSFLQRISCCLNDIPLPPLLLRLILLLPPYFFTPRSMSFVLPFPTLMLGSIFIQEKMKQRNTCFFFFFFLCFFLWLALPFGDLEKPFGRWTCLQNLKDFP